MDTKIQNYIKLVYSDKSELNSILDLEERKKAACVKSGLRVDDKKTQELIKMTNPDINDAIFKFLSEESPLEFQVLLSKEHLLSEQIRIVMEPLNKTTDDGKTIVDIDDEKLLKRQTLKNSLSNNFEDLLESILTLRRKIYKGEAEQKIAETKIVGIRLEQRLKKKN